MAQLLPDLVPPAMAMSGRYVERQLLETLQRGLPPAYVVFHDLDRVAALADAADILVVNRAGDVLRIDVAAGAVDVRAEGLFQRNGTPRIRLDACFAERLSSLRAQLRGARLAVQVGHLVVLTHVRVMGETTPWPRARLVDSSQMPQLVAQVGALLPPGDAQDAGERVRRFLEQQFAVATTVDAPAHGHDGSGRSPGPAGGGTGGTGSSVTTRAWGVPEPRHTTRLAPGLATWVPALQTPHGLLRIDAAAGAGKSQLALRLLEEADAAGAPTAYVAFNRAQAERMARLLPPHTHVRTFEALARELCQGAGQQAAPGAHTPSGPHTDGALAALARQASALLQARLPDVDLLVVDELHDMQASWVEALLWRLRPGGRALLLEDRDQRLSEPRLQFELPEATQIASADNFRSPRALVRAINALGLASRSLVARSAQEGQSPERRVYDDPETLRAQTIRAVEHCLALGFALGEIAVLVPGPRPESPLMQATSLGGWRLRRPSGRHDEDGQPVWSEGELMLDTVPGFKGQVAPAVVLTECHLPRWREIDRRLVLVALTRASRHVEWVLSGATQAALEAAPA